MKTEIERKFLVRSNRFKEIATKSIRIQQGYLSSHPERVVRIRISDKKAYLTIKGKGKISRFEWEKEIDLEEAHELLKICEPGIIAKTRYIVPAGNHIFEVDVFYGENLGLVVAEIELTSEDEQFEKPSWLGKEVSGIAKYYNASLKEYPYCHWK